MLVQLRADAEDDTLTTLDLYRWLRQDPDIRRHAEVALSPPPSGSETMGAVDIVNLVLGQAFTALNLALSYAAWRAARPTAPAVTITVDNRSVTVTGADEETVARIVELLRPGVEEHPAPAAQAPAAQAPSAQTPAAQDPSVQDPAAPDPDR